MDTEYNAHSAEKALHSDSDMQTPVIASDSEAIRHSNAAALWIASGFAPAMTKGDM